MLMVILGERFKKSDMFKPTEAVEFNTFESIDTQPTA